MSSPYTSVSISGFNASPPSDDGTQNAQNEVSWSKHKDKLGDPLKTAIESINTNVDSAFKDRWFNTVKTVSSNTTLAATDRGALVNASTTITVTLLAASTAGSGFELAVRNDGSGTVTVDGNSSETINGNTTVALEAGDALLLVCDGSNWFGPHMTASKVTTEGDLIVADSNGRESRKALGANHKVLMSNGTSLTYDFIETNNIADNNVTTAKIASGAVTTTEISANTIAQGDIANSAIGQGELKTSTASTSTGSLSSSSGTNLSLTGGLYSHWAIADSVFDAGGAADIEVRASTSGSNATIRLFNIESANASAILHERYHSASRPYDMGDGECGAFCQVVVMSDGSVDAVAIAPDPIWANNGPTDIRPDYIDKTTGKKYKRIRRPALTRADVDAGRADMADYASSMREAKVEDVEIDFAFKNADMDLFPHSWASPPQGTICLLDPVNTHDLLALHEAGEDVADLIHKGYIKVGDKVNRKGPPGVTPVSWKWK